MLTCFAILLPCVAYLFLWCLPYVFFYLFFFSLLWLIMYFCSCFFAYQCLCFFVCCHCLVLYGFHSVVSASSSGKKQVTCNLWFQVSSRQWLPLTLLYLMFLRHQRELILVHGTSETDTACGWLCSLREGLNFCVPSTPLRVCIQDPGISAESVLHSAFVDQYPSA